MKNTTFLKTLDTDIEDFELRIEELNICLAYEYSQSRTTLRINYRILLRDTKRLRKSYKKNNITS